MDDERRLGLAATFDTGAQRYADHRPTYPDELFEVLAAYGGLSRGARVLEVAPGTGQATVSMARRGWSITAVERGPAMAALARRAVGGQGDVEVVTSTFEEWPLPAAPFEALVCATAWHWLDPAVRLAKAMAALRPGGTLAIVRSLHVAGGTPTFFEASQEAYARFDPDLARWGVLPTEGSLGIVRVEELEASTLVGAVESHLFAVETGYARQDYLELLSTYSQVAALAGPRREALLDEVGALVDDLGGSVTKRYRFELDLARRR